MQFILRNLKLFWALKNCLIEQKTLEQKQKQKRRNVVNFFSKNVKLNSTAVGSFFIPEIREKVEFR